MSAITPKADIGCLLDYLIGDLFGGAAVTITPAYARDTYWVIQNRPAAATCL